MKTTIKIFTDAATEVKANKIMQQIAEKIEYKSAATQCLPYHKGGYVCHIEIELPANEWKTVPYRLLYQCQRIGQKWHITDAVEEAFDAWSNQASVPGVCSIHVQCLRHG